MDEKLIKEIKDLRDKAIKLALSPTVPSAVRDMLKAMGVAAEGVVKAHNAALETLKIVAAKKRGRK